MLPRGAFSFLSFFFNTFGIKMLSKKILGCPRCRKVSRLYPDLEPDEVFNETFLRVIENYEGKKISNLPGLFFMVSKSVAKDLRHGTIRPDQPEEPDLDKLSDYQKALDKYLIENDDEYSQVVEMFLLIPNIEELSRKTGLTQYQLRKHLDNAKNRIGFEYLNLKNYE